MLCTSCYSSIISQIALQTHDNCCGSFVSDLPLSSKAWKLSAHTSTYPVCFLLSEDVLLKYPHDTNMSH